MKIRIKILFVLLILSQIPFLSQIFGSGCGFGPQSAVNNNTNTSTSISPSDTLSTAKFFNSPLEPAITGI